jgi:invasion protein IalB
MDLLRALVARPAIIVAAAAASYALMAMSADAQQPAPAPAPAAPPPKAAPKQPHAKQPAQQKPAQAAPQAAPPAQAQTQTAVPAAQMPPLEYSAWVKVCGSDPQQPNSKKTCQTAKEAHLQTGQFMAAAQVIEREGEAKKILQVILPPGLLLQPGTRVIIDQGQPEAGPFVICFTNGCMAHYEVSVDFIDRLKKGQTLAIQAMNPNMQAVSFLLPLADFAKANEGPATDPKVVEEQQKKLQAELQERAKKLLENQTNKQ